MAPIHDPILAAARRPAPAAASSAAAPSPSPPPHSPAAAPPSPRPTRPAAKAAAPAAAATATTDLEVLNYALTLEHLEYAFYRDGLERFSARDFNRAGFRKPAYGRLKTIREHERIHVETLTDVIRDLGGDPVGEAPCYAFATAFGSVEAFLATAQLLENTGVSAYDGAIALIDSPELQTAGATIATVEARHAAYLNDLNGDSPFPEAFDEPKTPEEVLAAAAPFFDCEAGA
jgi:rubrerythrin